MGLIQKIGLKSPWARSLLVSVARSFIEPSSAKCQIHLVNLLKSFVYVLHVPRSTTMVVRMYLHCTALALI
jgi:hypothetical protein